MEVQVRWHRPCPSKEDSGPSALHGVRSPQWTTRKLKDTGCGPEVGTAEDFICFAKSRNQRYRHQPGGFDPGEWELQSQHELFGQNPMCRKDSSSEEQGLRTDVSLCPQHDQGTSLSSAPSMLGVGRYGEKPGRESLLPSMLGVGRYREKPGGKRLLPFWEKPRQRQVTLEGTPSTGQQAVYQFWEPSLQGS